jgi:hypothetical protein
MTISTTTRKQTFAGAQGTLTFTFVALPDHPEDIKVKKVLTSTGVETGLTYGVDYSVAVATDGVGGVVTVSPSVSSLYTQVVYRETANKQESDYDDYNQFPADTVEEDLDRRTMVAQEQAESVDRALKLPISSSLSNLEIPSPTADTYLGWNSAATALENKTLSSLGVVAKATQSVAEAGTNNTDYMTPAQVKNEVQKASLLAIPDSNLSQITTASKVSGAALTSLANIPSGAGVIPAVNLPAYLSVSDFVFTRDPSSDDFSVGNFTADGQWHDLDLSSIVGVGRRLVLLCCVLSDDQISMAMQFRTKGNSNAYNVGMFNNQIANAAAYGNVIVLTDTSGVIQYYLTSNTYTAIYVRVRGWVKLS